MIEIRLHNDELFKASKLLDGEICKCLPEIPKDIVILAKIVEENQ